MSRKHLHAAAVKVGILPSQAEALMRELLHPTLGQANAGSDIVGLASVMFSPNCPAELRGQTGGEAGNTEAAAVWRRMVSGLLIDAPDDGWEHQHWPHPRSEMTRDWAEWAKAHGREG
ncbi:MAG: hypothetical protein KKA05_11890 [Alphaproteobacteria bacterium]|nr:hypothetical protein [Alphaproteobacteria bacterium]